MARFQENGMKLMECPRDVLELVISFLPVADMFRLRTVCKEWNEVITTRAFQENGQLRFNKLELLTVCNGYFGSSSREFKAYDFMAKKWYSLNLSFFPDIGGFRVLDFAGGLACVTQMGDMRRGLYVCNPLTKKWARLPSPPISINSSSAHVIVKMHSCRKTGHYKVFVVSGFGVNDWMYNRLVVEKFDSSAWTWAVHSQICHPFRWYEVRGMCVLPNNNGNDASLFILLYKILNRHPNGRQLFALLFDEEKGDLGLVKISAALPSNLLNPTMVCCEQNPHPLLVSAVGDRNGATGVEIWELGNQLTEWRNLATMPSSLFTYFRNVHIKDLVETRKKVLMPGRPLTAADIISLTAVAVAAKHLVHIRPKSVVSWKIAYNTSRGSWHWLCTKLPLQINETKFSPQISALGCTGDSTFEPSLENVVSPLDMDF